jgi:hypothetical protein
MTALTELHNHILAARNALHKLDGSNQTDYAQFKDPRLNEAARLMHVAYSFAVTAEQQPYYG